MTAQPLTLDQPIPAPGAFRPLKPRGQGAGAAAVAAGIRMGSRFDRYGYGHLQIRFGEQAAAAMGLRRGDRVVVLIAEQDGATVLWIRRPRNGDRRVRRVLRQHAQAPLHLSMMTTGLRVPALPSTAQRWAAHPDGGLLIWPVAEAETAARMMAASLEAAS